MSEATAQSDVLVQTETLALCQNLMARASITPADEGCQEYIRTRLERCGFHCEAINVGKVQNLWAGIGVDGPLLVLAGHTDVVPTGPEAEWDSPPFSPTIRGEKLYGRGAADMKSGVAAMVTAAERLVASDYLKFGGRLALLLTSDEEGPAVDGTLAVLKWLKERGEQIDWCLVGEPSSDQVLGDRIRIGRRGSINGILKIRGVQGHVAYPDQVTNPIPAAITLLDKLGALDWDTGNDHFPPTRLQITNIKSGAGVHNVTPNELEAWFNLRFNTCQTADSIMERIEALCKKCELSHELSWEHSGDPFLTTKHNLIDAVTKTIETEFGISPMLSTDGGTSDGRFIAKTGAEVVELGPVSANIHQANENCRIEDIGRLSRLYESIIKRMLGSGEHR